MLEEQLVVVATLADEVEHLHAYHHVHHADVSCLAPHVLRVGHPADGPVESWTAIAGGDDDAPEAVAQGFQHPLAEVAQAGDVLPPGRIVDMEALSRCRANELAEREVLR